MEIKRKLIEIGTSSGFILPKIILDSLGLKQNDEVMIDLDSIKLIKMIDKDRRPSKKNSKRENKKHPYKANRKLAGINNGKK